MGRDRAFRCHARNAGRDGRARRQRRYDRQHHRPGTSLCSWHKKGTQETETLGRSRGGFTTKLHARCDAKGRPLGFVLTPGQTHDTQGVAPLFRMIAGLPPNRLIASCFHPSTAPGSLSSRASSQSSPDPPFVTSGWHRSTGSSSASWQALRTSIAILSFTLGPTKSPKPLDMIQFFETLN
ncbi:MULTISPECIES: transposase [Mesorhizobium]